MNLPSELIDQFVKITNDKPETKKETTVYGTTVEHEGVTYVKLDGSELLTPVNSTADAKAGERVTVMIKNHTATITGNISSPAARSEDLKTVAGDTSDIGKKITEFEIAVGNKADVSELNASNARIDDLVSDNVTIKQNLASATADIDILQANEVTITQQMNANKANIENLQTTKLDATVADAKYATIENLNATNANVNNLEATYGDFADLTSDKLEALEAEISKLEAGDISVEQLKATFATIAQLEVERGRITDLEADVADIDTLIFGSATGSTIQTSFANAVITMLGNAQIKSAMIDSLVASKITSGDIITDKVRVKSEDGKLLISDQTIQVSDSTRVRVQIGKDAASDYSINIWDADGNLMFSKGGITDSAIKSAIIRNDMVSDTANIAAHKLDIDSLFEEINGSSKTIKSSRVYLDEQKQSLDVAFKEVTTDVDNLQSSVSSQGTEISAVQGQISSKIWQQDINTSIDSLEIGGRNLFAISHSEEGYLLVQGDALGPMNSVRKEHTSEFIPVIEGDNYIFQAWATIDDADTNDPCLWIAYDFFDSEKNPTTNRPAKRSTNTLTNGQCYDLYNILVPTGASYIRVSTRLYSDGLVKLEKGTKATDWTPAPEDVNGDITTLFTKYSSIEETVNSIATTVAEHTSEIDKKADSSTVTTINDKVSKLEQDVDGFKLTASDTYATKTELADYSTTSQMNAAIELSADNIKSSVSSTYATKETVNDIQIGGRNLCIESNYVSGYLAAAGTISAAGDGTNEQTTDFISVTPGETISVQYWVTLSDSSWYPWHAYQYYNSDKETVGNRYAQGYSYTEEYSHIQYILSVPDGATYIRLSMRMYDDGKMKLEKGNKATDWTPAVEDMATSDALETVQSSADLVEERVSISETLIEQLSDSLATLVTDSNGESLMTQVSGGWTFSTAEIQSTVDETSEKLNNLVNEVGDVDSTVSILQQAVDDLGVLNEYVKIRTYEGEPCIELGERDSDFKLLITNTKIMFMEGSDVPAYLNNQSLFIKKAVIEEELQQGEFLWQARSNGNLGLIWKGATS